jgi:tRNA pseudouridine38/39 synthase
MSASRSRRAALEALSRDELIELALRVSPSEMPASGAGSSESTSKPTKRHKEQRPFDMSRYAQRHVALRVAYIGTAYQGFAYQVETEDTVEGRVLEALMKTRLITDRASSGVSCGGRTDKGVSALGQVLALRVRSNLVDGEGVIAPLHAPPSAARSSPAAADPPVAPPAAAPPMELDYCHLLNRVLPPDIRVTAWSPTDAQFSARFSATHRTYKYFFARAGLDVERMAEGARRLLGEHDFRNFCKIDPSVTNFRRSVLAAAIQPASGGGGGEDADSPLALWEFEVRGTAFLYHQVRCMVAVLFLIGEGKEAPTIVSELLDTARYPRRPNYEIASEAPLLLHEIGYEDLVWRTSPAALAEVHSLWGGQLQEQSLRFAMLRTMHASLEAAHEGPCAAEVDEPARKRGRGAASHVPLAMRPTAESVEHRTQGRAQ